MQDGNVSSIEKALLILKQLGSPPYEYKVGDLAKVLGLNRSSVYRILQVLKSHGTVSHNTVADIYKVGPEMYHIGSSYLYGNYMNQLHDVLVEMSEETKESVGMAIKDNGKIISLFEAEVHQPMKLNYVPGMYFPVNKGSYGKCITAYEPPEEIERILRTSTFEKNMPNTMTTREELLAEYAKIRQQGFVTSIDESGIDILGVGIPLFRKDGTCAACIAVAFFRSDGWERKLDELRMILLSYKDRLERYFP